MKRIIDKANRIYAEHGDDLDRIAESLGLNVVTDRLAGRLKEYHVGNSIVVNESVSEKEKRELIAHAIGHHLFHAGNHLAMQKRIYSFGNHHEKQANVFAACLLMPSERFLKIIKGRPRVDEIAGHFGVREELVRMRLMVWVNYERDLTGRQSARVG